MPTVTQPGSTELRATPQAYPFPAATRPPGTHQEDGAAGRGAYSPRDPSAHRAPQGRGSSGLMLGPHPSRQAAIQAGHRDTGTLCGQPARLETTRQAVSSLGGMSLPAEPGQGKVRRAHCGEAHRPRGDNIHPSLHRPCRSLEGTALRAPLGAPPHASGRQSRPAPGAAPPPWWGPREAVARATAPSPWQRGGRHAGAGPGPARSISRPQAGPGGLRGFPPWASGAAGEGAMRGGKGSALPRCWGCPPSGVRGRSPGKGIVPRRLWTCPWSQGDRGKPDNASQTEGQSLTTES